MSHTMSITEAKQSLTQTEQIVSRLEQSEWAYKMIAADELRNTQNGLVQYIEECESGEFDYDASEFLSDIVKFTKDLMLADKILLSI